jgi:hypothetical protein
MSDIDNVSIFRTVWNLSSDLITLIDRSAMFWQTTRAVRRSSNAFRGNELFSNTNPWLPGRRDALQRGYTCPLVSPHARRDAARGFYTFLPALGSDRQDRPVGGLHRL